MKILFDHPQPFLLAHGGFQIQIEQTKAALETLGVEVEHLRWWDDRQRGDLIHFFGRPPELYIQLAHAKQMRVVVAELLTGLGSRSAPARFVQRLVIQIARATLPQTFTARLAWNSYQLADAVVALTPWEARLMTEMFGAPPSRVHVVPNGVEAAFFTCPPTARGPWLVCTTTITERKRIIELAEAAVLARTPLWIIGKPYSESDSYGEHFLQLVKKHTQWLRYEGAIHNREQMAGAYREARGFVLLSTMESLSLSSLEAAACECPLLLSDLPWARTVFGPQASYCPVTSERETARRLRQFYDAAPSLPLPTKPLIWREVAQQMKAVYEAVLNTSR